jgi:hypothetical protein
MDTWQILLDIRDLVVTLQEKFMSKLSHLKNKSMLNGKNGMFNGLAMGT